MTMNVPVRPMPAEQCTQMGPYFGQTLKDIVRMNNHKVSMISVEIVRLTGDMPSLCI